jgi:PKD repeat protein
MHKQLEEFHSSNNERIQLFHDKKLGILVVVSLIAIFAIASMASAQLLPHGIKGTVFMSDGITQAPWGTHFSVNDTTSGFFIEGTTGAGPNSGFYSVSITGEDGDDVIIKAWNASHYGTTTVTLAGDMDGIDVIIDTPIEEKQPPVADSNGPYTGTEGVSVTFDGSGSSDPDGTIVSYAWDFGDGTTGTGVNPAHTYAQDGTYTVTLTVTDNDGLTDTATTAATIAPEEVQQPPVADPNGPYTGTEGIPVNFDGSGSSDPDGTIVSYAWDFGDGTTGTGVNPAHTYAQDGTYTVTLTVTDNDGLTDTATTTATIAPEEVPPPVADPNGPYTGTEGIPVTFDGSGSSDPDGTIVSYDWDFGDGTTGTGVNPTHTYTQDGTYTVTLTVTDNDGLTHIATTSIVIVVDVPTLTPLGIVVLFCVIGIIGILSFKKR